MPDRVYFDTVVFRAVGKAFEKNSLASDLMDRIIISPLTLFEVWSQLTITNADEILRQIHSVSNWANPTHTGLLRWPDDALFEIWFQKSPPDDGCTERMQRAFNTCLATSSVKSLQVEAGQLKDAIDRMNQQTADNFRHLLEAARKNPLEPEKASEAWFQGIANRVMADSKSRSLSEIVSTLNAYHEFEMSKLQVAMQNKDYNPEKHKNDLLDAEQLIYLSDASMCFLTCDTGFRNLVRKSPQAKRIITASLAELADAPKIEGLLRKNIPIAPASKIT
jgi:hypothetical protein